MSEDLDISKEIISNTDIGIKLLTEKLEEIKDPKMLNGLVIYLIEKMDDYNLTEDDLLDMTWTFEDDFLDNIKQEDFEYFKGEYDASLLVDKFKNLKNI